ncbi:hypothetical protein F511_46700 [Dorcoceras hygrometricum]|uniref:Uncharacterized protein n=1 Tax=Dorcoceras hygrometricum TaxID=472368 RepID=A0A2Z6ZSW3_9LAMI|nr:hypothetical protein F511_46700 [Dorcoceras hygrometricum]
MAAPHRAHVCARDCALAAQWPATSGRGVRAASRAAAQIVARRLLRCWLAAAPCACRTMEHDDRAPHAQAVAPLDGWTPHWLRAAVLPAWRDDACGRASRLARRCARPCVALCAASCDAAASFFVVAAPPAGRRSGDAPAMS